MSTHKFPNQDNSGRYGYKIVIHVNRERGDLNGRIRAAREMATVAMRQPGFVGLETKKRNGRVSAFILHWITLEDIDSWRSKIYDSALSRYGVDAWQTFVDIELEQIPETKHKLHNSSTFAATLHGAAERIFSNLSLQKSA